MVFLTLLTGCQPREIPTGPWVKKIDSEELSRLVINFSAKMAKEQHLFLEDSYAAYNDSISKICLRYSSQRLLTLEEARLQIVEIVEEFLYRLNNNTVLGFELETFPFTANNLDVRINFESFFGIYVDPLYIGQTWLNCGCVDFYAFDRKDNNIDWDHHRFEPYFKSRELALLQKEAKIPDEERIENPPKRPQEYLYDRYLPYQPGVVRRLPMPKPLFMEQYQDVNPPPPPPGAIPMYPQSDYRYVNPPPPPPGVNAMYPPPPYQGVNVLSE